MFAFTVSDGGDPLAGSLAGFGDPGLALLLVLGLMSLVVAIIWRDATVFALAGLCTSALLTLLFVDGVASGAGVLDWLGSRVDPLVLFSSVALLFAVRHSRKFARLGAGPFWLRRTLTVAEGALIAIAVLSLVIESQANLISLLSVIGFVLGIALVAVSSLAWRQGNRSAGFLALAWIWLVGVGATHRFFGREALLGEHTLHAAVAGAVLLLFLAYIDRVLGFRRNWIHQLASETETGNLLRVERSRRDFADDVTELIRTLDPGLYEETILKRFLEYLANMVPVAGAAVAISHRGDVRLVALGEDSVAGSFESILATREQLLQSVCLSDRAAVIHSDDLGVSAAGDSASCLGIVPVDSGRNEWAGVLLARSGDLEFGLEELELVGDFAHQAYEALRNAQQFRKVRREAETDPLTGIFNRRAILARGKRKFKKAQSLKFAMSLLFVDVDHFKQINDQWGHPIGDIALQRVAKVCGESLREDDFIGRYGGEEFLAVLPGAGAKDAAHVAERLRATVENEIIAVDGTNLTLTVSVGISELSSTFTDFEAMLRAADRALYRAKREGRNRVVHHRYMLRGDRVTKPFS